uniref:Uncharacterized protein n=1 Tax=Opuntia streptacantha TaxID=393608 RepID=A0A7C9AUE5_OPUST
MLPVKLVRSLVLGETMDNPFLHHDDDPHAHDADNEDDDAHDIQNHHYVLRRAAKEEKMKKKKNRRRLPLLLFTPTGELISDTFRLAAIARDIGMDFHPTPSLSHLIFSWPTPSSSPPSSSSSTSSSWASLSTPSTSSPLNNNRPSVSSTTTSSSSTSLWTTLLPNDAVPLPFPSLSAPSTSLSLLRYFVSLSKGLFKLVFFNFDPDSEIQPGNFNYRKYYHDSNCSPSPFLHSRVSSRRVGSMDDFSTELAGHGWTLFRNRQKPKCPSSESDLVYLFRKKELNRVRARGAGGGGHVGECRVRELRLPALDFKNAVPLRTLLYILLMTDDVFYLA